ncbi:hypothetical protein C2S53_013045 [Perilla frutescens var. hirtella]|uniref:HAT C-terminal dimerisation domain-containing protein n=1 Tax=Perilla frutescens var. hirtella TaxID=608512 RepID=A0AAD4J462_PERFH|nr:hypothetical protein C2S53_013045 [Perilla frutescens var. hirtella]
MNKLIFMVVVLDPIYKLEFMEFVLQKEYGFEEGKQLTIDLSFEMDELFDEYRALHQPQSDGTNNESSSRLQSLEKKPLYNVCTMDDMFKRMRRGSGDTRKNEIDVYLKEDPLDVETNDFDKLKWWKLNHMRFPILSLIVRDILSHDWPMTKSPSAPGSSTLKPPDFYKCRSNMSGSESDAPEEFTSEQGMQQDEDIRKVQKENKARVVREVKERRRQWAQKLTPRSLPKEESAKHETENETREESLVNKGMLPDDIVKLLAEREKKVFTSDSEDEKVEKKSASKKRKSKKHGLEPVILKDLPPAQCVQSSLEFLKKRKMQVSRSSAVLNNSSQALRLLSKSGLLK